MFSETYRESGSRYFLFPIGKLRGKKRYSKKFYKIRTVEPEEKHGSKIDYQVTVIALFTALNLENFEDGHEEDIIPVNLILESWVENRTATELGAIAHGVDWVIEESDLPIKGYIAQYQWCVRGPIVQYIIEVQDSSKIS